MPSRAAGCWACTSGRDGTLVPPYGAAALETARACDREAVAGRWEELLLSLQQPGAG